MRELPLRKKDAIRVRIAPSPTGPLHIGTARTALFNFLFARKRQGVFILRIEDTDLERSDPKWEKDILENLKWLGILWDEGPVMKTQNSPRRQSYGASATKLKTQNYIGDFRPYRQSERGKIYEKYIKKMLDEGYLYWCFCSKEELEAQRQEQMARGEAPRYTGRCRNLSMKEIAKFKREGKKGILRFKVPSTTIKVDDLIRGKLEFDTGLLGDIAVARNFSTPFYNLAVVIDDFEMKISHVIRGEDHIPNTPKQILFQEALGFPRPEYAHLPLILGPDRSKLSKRHGAVSIGEYEKQGYLPGALINFMAFLGWNPGTDEEIFSTEELIKRFSLDRVQKSGAIFNIKRLDWLNGYYIRKTPIGELVEKCLPYLVENKKLKVKGKKYEIVETKEMVDFIYLEEIITLFQERVRKFSRIVEASDFFFKDKLSFEKGLLFWMGMGKEDVQKNLEKCYKILEKIEKESWQREKIREVLMKESEKALDRGYILWPLRVALTGKKGSPPPFEIAEILGKERTLKRIEEAMEILG